MDGVKEEAYRAYNHAQMISVEHEGEQVMYIYSGCELHLDTNIERCRL